MSTFRFAIAAALLAATGCRTAYTSIGYDLQTRGRGKAAASVVEADSVRGSVALGFAAGPAAMELKLNGHDLAMDDHAVEASGGLELNMRLLAIGPSHVFVHGGPMRAMRVDTDAMNVTWGVGYSYGGGISLDRGSIGVFADVRGESLWYVADTMDETGAGSFSAITVGLIVGR